MSGTIHTAEDIAMAFAVKAKEDQKSPLTHKKLQKLLYYAQAWNLVFNGKKLFREEIQAWVHGPVVPSLYSKFKSFGPTPFELKEGVKVPKLRKEEQQVVDSVWKIYGKYDADYLEVLTHNEAPWLEAREGLDAFEPCQRVISTKRMKEFYGEKLQEAKA